MAGIRMTGMASGLPPNIVEQIMDAERIPVQQMESKKAADEDRLKLIQDLETKISDISKPIGELTNSRGFTSNKLLSGDPNVVNGIVDPNGAMNGTWQIEVLQLAQKPGALTNGFPDRDRTQLGVGYLQFDTPDGRKEVYISEKNSTLDGVSAAINSANMGLRSMVIQDRKDKENPFRLLVTGLATGDDKQIAFPTVYMMDGDQDVYFENSRPAQNAKIRVDGFDVEVPENTIKDIIPGVVLELRQASPGREIAVSIKEDFEVISGKIKSFVDAYNQVLNFIQTQNRLARSKNGKESLGPLGGDSLLRSIEHTFRELIQSPQMGVHGSIQQISGLGIEFNRNGTLNFNADRFNRILSSYPADVAEFIRGDGFNTGFVPSLKREIGNIVNSSFGPIPNRKRGIQSKIDRINEQIDQKEKYLARREESLRKKFADLETTMSKLQTQGAAFGAAMGGGQGGAQR